MYLKLEKIQDTGVSTHGTFVTFGVSTDRLNTNTHIFQKN